MRSKVWMVYLFLIFGAGLGSGIAISGPEQENKNSEDGDRSKYYRKWLSEDVDYIITDEERAVFKDLKTDEEREKFIEQFWERRNPDPRASYNEFKEEHYRRIAYANERYHSGIPGWKTDRGRIYIVFGKPDEIESHPSGGTYQREPWEGGGTTSTYPFERWRYRHLDGLGDDVEIEFVDPTMTGEYRIAMSPDEKDALMNVPGAGLTDSEAQGLTEKKDRPYFNPDNANSSTYNRFMRAKDQPFARLEQYFNLQRPPQIKFQDLKGMVTTRVTFNTLAYNMRTDFLRLSSDKVLVPFTIELQNRDLTFKKEMGINRALVNVYGIVTGLTGRILAEFEDVVMAEYADESFEQGKNARSEYQKIVALPPGQRFKLDLVLKDVNSGNTGLVSRGFNVPKYDGETLQSSTIILANRITRVPTYSNELEQYVIGDLKILPNVKSEYVAGQDLIPYLQIYNATLDQASQKPSLEVTYTVKSAGEVVEEQKDLTGQSIQFFSGQRVVVIGTIPLKKITPGKYTLTVTVLDRISSRTVVTETGFNVNEPTQTAWAAKP
jgi:GWxTD domain-containing protein